MDTVPPLVGVGGEGLPTGPGQNQLLDLIFPGFSVLSSAVHKYLHIDLNVYIPSVLLISGIVFAWRYFTDYFWGLIESHLMSVVDLRSDDELWNFVMSWVASQSFAQRSRRFVANTNVNSRSWHLWRSFEDDDEGEEGEEGGSINLRKKKALAYTPTFGSHWFFYKGRILIFRRTQNTQQSGFMTASEREEMSISCFGRNPWILKELLHEAREQFLKKDEAKTLIYRGTTKSGSSEPQWQRCMARTSRPFSTVILNEKVKKELIDDVTDYLNPATRRWYANRGIPYRRGYLLYGPPGTGKSSLSLALAGFFKMRIYIVSLSSVTANEENLASLFAELPRRCVVLLEDIDTAGLTHTREDGSQGTSDGTADESSTTARTPRAPGAPAPPNPNAPAGRLSLSGLLNILDGVASQEGRVLIMTTNHLEKLDKALIRPGRVDMIVKFDRADASMTAQIFKAIYAPLEGDETIPLSSLTTTTSSSSSSQSRNPFKSAVPRPTPEDEKNRAAAEADAAQKKADTIARVDELAAQFAAAIPELEFSPAEIQGWLLKNKRDPERAVAGAAQWVVDARKERKEKEIKDAEERRKKEEEERKEREKKEEKKRRKKVGKKGKRKGGKKDGGSGSEDDGSASDEEDGSASESSSSSESEQEEKKVRRKKKGTTTKSKAAASPAQAAGPAPDAVSAAPVELKEEDPAVGDVVVPAITVDTVKAKEATDVPQRTPGADSGYGTPA